MAWNKASLYGESKEEYCEAFETLSTIKQIMSLFSSNRKSNFPLHKSGLTCILMFDF